MALWDDLPFGSVTATTLTGLGALLAAPVLVPLVGAVVRPVLRLAVFAGVSAYDVLVTTVATAGEQMSDLIAEAVAEARPAPDARPPEEDIAPHIIRPEGASA